MSIGCVLGPAWSFLTSNVLIQHNVTSEHFAGSVSSPRDCEIAPPFYLYIMGNKLEDKEIYKGYILYNRDIYRVYIIQGRKKLMKKLF